MTTVAPAALTALSKALPNRADCPKDYLMDGIVGNTEHLDKACESGTYHISAEDCCSKYGHLYSLDTADDIAGGKAHPTWAAAWDLHWGPADMILVTTRLIEACKAKDPRMAPVAEIAGTTNGHSVHAFYNNTGKDDPNNTGRWDDGHLTHNHLSFKRNHLESYEALAGINDVICGVPLHPNPPAVPKEKQMIVVNVAPAPGGHTGPGTFTFDGSKVHHIVSQADLKVVLAGLGKTKVDGEVTYAQYTEWTK